MKKKKKRPGLSTNRFYFRWASIKARCRNPNHRDYKYYGARGIDMYDEWYSDPWAFFDYIKKLEYCGEPGMTLDRRDNDKGYVPGNLRWVDQHTQVWNRRTPSKLSTT